MTLMGKILTFLIFIMSLVFMMFTLATYAQHRNWRKEHDAMKNKHIAATNLFNEADAKNKMLEQQLQRERASRAQALATKEQANALMAQELAALDKKWRDLSTDHRTNLETVKMAQRQMEKAKNELLTLRADYQKALDSGNTQLGVATELADRIQDTVGQLTSAENKIKSLNGTLAKAILDKERAALGMGQGGARIAGQAALNLDGRVRRIGTDDLVVVSLGSDEGLNRGDRLDVWRDNGDYIGRLVVIETETDSAVAKIIPEYRRGVIRQGDNVATKLLSS